MLEGLEVSEVALSYAFNNNDLFRLDSEYFQKTFLRDELVVRKKGGQTLAALGVELRSFGAYSLNNAVEYLDAGVPFIRGVNMKHGRVLFHDLIYINDAANALLWKSAVKPGMVLLSMSGTIGDAALASASWTYPINSNQDIAKIDTQGKISPHFLLAFLLSKFGQNYLAREARGSVQQHVFLSQIGQFETPQFSTRFDIEIESLVNRSERSHLAATDCQATAELCLLRNLGLESWVPLESRSYIRTSKEAFTAGRLDAEYFSPSVHGLLVRLSEDQMSVGDVAPSRHEPFKPNTSGDFDYIEIGNLRGDGTVTADQVPMREAPSRANQFVRTGDVITSTVRPIRRLSAVVSAEQNGAVCSSGFVVLQPTHVAPEVLVTYLRLPIICQLMDLHTSASLYPAISERDLLSLPIPRIDKKTQAAICGAVLSARRARDQAAELLEAAKRAVEIAIEDSEAAALKYLKSVVQ